MVDLTVTSTYFLVTPKAPKYRPGWCYITIQEIQNQLNTLNFKLFRHMFHWKLHRVFTRSVFIGPCIKFDRSKSPAIQVALFTIDTRLSKVSSCDIGRKIVRELMWVNIQNSEKKHLKFVKIFRKKADIWIFFWKKNSEFLKSITHY
jgi:hypothetical protein